MTRPLEQDSSVEVIADEVDRVHGVVPVWRYRPLRNAEGTPATLVWVHGGGFFRGDLALPEAHRVSLALAGRGIPVVSVDYRLVAAPGMGWARRPGRPSVRFPVPMQDVLDVMRQVSDESGSRYFVGGASAGACLAASAVIEAAATEATPLGAVLAYGFFHARNPIAPDIARLVRGHRRITHSRLALDLANRNYAGSKATWNDPRAFPGGSTLRAFPPTLMVDAERDSMRASAELFARQLSDADIPLERHVLAGARHAFLNRPDEPDFATTIELMADWIRRSAR